jgi:hypothetical protein
LKKKEEKMLEIWFVLTGFSLIFVIWDQLTNTPSLGIIKNHWKQALGSEIHCVAGDATAIIIAAAILHLYELA